MPDENQLSGWSAASSPTEQEKQARTVRMVDEAIAAHPAFSTDRPRVYAKGSYPNQTHVRTESDVDVAVQITSCFYWEEEADGQYTPAPGASRGPWGPGRLREEVEAALKAKFPGQVSPGSVALAVEPSSARVSADVTPCFNFRHYYAPGRYREGSRIFRRNLTVIKNYPAQQLAAGNAKDVATLGNYKRVVRIIKRVGYNMAENNHFEMPPSFLIESLVFNCPDSYFRGSTWTIQVRDVLTHIWRSLQGDSEPASGRLVEANGCKFLFKSGQSWTREDGREFAKAAWNYLGYTS